MADVIYNIDANAPADGFNQPSITAAGTHYESTFGNRNLITNDHQLKLRILSDIRHTNGQPWGSFSTDSTHFIEIYGWDTSTNSINRNRTLRTSEQWSGVLQIALAYTYIHDIYIDNDSPYNGVIWMYGANSRLERCKITNSWCVANNISHGELLYIQGENITICFNLFIAGYGLCTGIHNRETWTSNPSIIYNNVVVNCNIGYIVKAINGFGYPRFSNNVAYNCTTMFDTTGDYSCFNYNRLVGRNNASTAAAIAATPYLGSTPVAMDDTDFNDYANGDYTIHEYSKLRHTHVDYPTGDNTYSSYIRVAEDVNNSILPTSYSDDTDRWDTGIDYWASEITGITWEPQSSGEITLTNSTVLVDTDNLEPNTTFENISSNSNKDTFIVRNNRTINLSYNNLNGYNIIIEDGSFNITNDSDTTGIQQWGWLQKKIKIYALGKLIISGKKILLDTVGNITTSSWTNIWGTTTDDTGRYAEPSVIFIGSSIDTAIPYFNIGGRTDTIANDITHGRTFNFNNTTGLITFPDHQPTSTHNIYIYNIIIHAKDGINTPGNSYGFDTYNKGQVEISNAYITGECYFWNATKVNISAGIFNPLIIRDSRDLSFDIYRGISSTYLNTDTSRIINANNEILGNIYSLSVNTPLSIEACKNSTFNKIWSEVLTDTYAVICGGVNAGNDNLSISELTMIGGSFRVQFGQIIKLNIDSIIHSNDISGSLTRSSQNVFIVDSIGSRNITISNIELAENGISTQKSIVKLVNTGNFEIYNINYNGIVQSVLNCNNSFNGYLATALCSRFTQQAIVLSNSCKSIIVKNIIPSSLPNTIPTFDEYNTCEDILLQKVAYQGSGEYKDWVKAIPDLNFMELIKYGTPYTGIIAFQFNTSSSSTYTLYGSTRSNQDNAVLFHTSGDYIETTSPYNILVGNHTSFFADISPEIIGSNVTDLSLEYSININSLGYSSYKTLSQANLISETFNIEDSFSLRLRITSSTNETRNLQRIIIHTLPDEEALYPNTSTTVTLTDIASGTEIHAYVGNDPSTSIEIGYIESSSTSFTFSQSVAGEDGYITFIKPGMVPLKLDITYSDSNISIPIQQTIDRSYYNP